MTDSQEKKKKQNQALLRAHRDPIMKLRRKQIIKAGSFYTF